MIVLFISVTIFTINQSEGMSTDLIWLGYHGHLAKFGYIKYLIIPFLVHFGFSIGIVNDYPHV